MKKFMDKDFLLSTPTAVKLFDECKDEPIFDWHCHLSPKEIYENKEPENITQLWLYADHYKWRGMRGCGIDEKYITGDASDYEKFVKWSQVMSSCIGNPLYHWTHLELQRYFGIETPLSPATADEIWEKANAKIKQGGFAPRDLIEKSNVACVCTTDDPADTLEYHKLLSEDSSFKCKVLPAFRPDKALYIDSDAFASYIASLENVSEKKADSFCDLKSILSDRINLFEKMGCRATDHAFTYMPYEEATEEEIDEIFKSAKKGEKITQVQADKYKTKLMIFLAEEYSKRNWGMEIHLGPMRNNNTYMFNKVGPDTGFDSINDKEQAETLSKFLNRMASVEKLPKTILFVLNPKDNYVIGSMLGNFQSSEIPSKIQFGSGWWFNDNIDGMQRQMKDLANLGIFGKFLGMVTDSRSFLSYPRHEYFRRIMCEFIGNTVENGEYPNDMDALSKIVKDVSFYNAKNYFGI